LAASKAEGMLRQQLDLQKGEAFKLNEHVAQYAILKHEVESSSTLYDTLDLKLKEATVSAGLSSSYISVVDRAVVPDKPIEPKVLVNLALGLFGGLIGGLVLGSLLESLDDTVRTSEDLQLIAAIPALGTIPSIATLGRTIAKRKGLSGSNEVNKGYVGPAAFLDTHSDVAEAFRALRTSMLLSFVDHSPKVLLVTSGIAGEGKSTVAANLAVVLAQAGETVLLVDADLRRPTLLQQFGIVPEKGSIRGLSTILATGSEEDALIVPIETLPNLSVIPSGPHPPSPADALASRRMKELMKAWSGRYDRVIIDSAPILAVADSRPLAASADAVILVVDSRSSRVKAVQRTKDVLLRSNATILGAVLNRVNMQLEYFYTYPMGYTSKYATAYPETEQN
jgi:capsular exopolysaccharide synthesis family protein